MGLLTSKIQNSLHMMRILGFNCDKLSSTISLHSFKLIDSHKCSNTSGSMKSTLYCPVQINGINVAVLNMQTVQGKQNYVLSKLQKINQNMSSIITISRTTLGFRVYCISIAREDFTLVTNKHSQLGIDKTLVFQQNKR